MSLPLVIDVEASGLGRGSYPIEVGVAMPDGETRCMIIRPQQDWLHWDQQAEQMHGISRAVLQQFGRHVADVAHDLNQWLAGEVVYSDAWGNDSSWLALLFDCAGVAQQFKLESLRSLLSEEQVQYWHQVKEQVILESDFCRHRASNDALILQATFVETLKMVNRQPLS
jgi:hypothetical protein